MYICCALCKVGDGDKLPAKCVYIWKNIYMCLYVFSECVRASFSAVADEKP